MSCLLRAIHRGGNQGLTLHLDPGRPGCARRGARSGPLRRGLASTSGARRAPPRPSPASGRGGAGGLGSIVRIHRFLPPPRHRVGGGVAAVPLRCRGRPGGVRWASRRPCGWVVVMAPPLMYILLQGRSGRGGLVGEGSASLPALHPNEEEKIDECASAPRRMHSYVDGPPRQVPGFESLTAWPKCCWPSTFRRTEGVLVLGAGGGMELKALAEAQSGWSFDEWIPRPTCSSGEGDGESSPRRVALHQGRRRCTERAVRWGDEPAGLPLHREGRARRHAERTAPPAQTGRSAGHRDISFPQQEPERSRWIARQPAWGAPPGTDPADLASARGR